MLLRALATAILVCLSVIPVLAQGYDTKFKEVGFKPGDVYHTDEGVNISLTGGAVEVSLPLGPALPGPIPLQPVIHYHGKYSQGLNPNWDYLRAFQNCSTTAPAGTDCDAIAKADRRWGQPSLPMASLTPGKLLFSHGAFGSNGNSAPIRIDSPQGQSQSFWLDQAGAKAYYTQNPDDVAHLDKLVSSLAPEWTRPSNGNTVGAAVLGDVAGARLSDGSILIFGPSNATVFNRYYADHTFDVQSRIPDEILQVAETEIVLWQRSRHTMQTVWDRKADAPMMDYFWNGTVFHPVWIKNRSGFKVTINVSRDAAGGPAAVLTGPGIFDDSGIPKMTGLLRGWEVYYFEGSGNKVGYRVDRTTTGCSACEYAVTYVGMAGTPSTTGLGATGRTPLRSMSAYSPTDPLWQPGTTEGWYAHTGDSYDLDYESSELAMQGTTIVHGPLTTTLDWSGPYGMLAQLTTPRGKTYAFKYQILQGIGVRSPSDLGEPMGWLYSRETPGSMDYWSVVTQMDVTDNQADQVRSTIYQWAIPQPNTVTPSYWVDWTRTTQGVAQTLPDGQTILHVFASPVNASSYGTTPNTNLDYKARTFLATRQTTVARYTYASGDKSWQSFFSGGDPTSTTWYKRERMEGWDFRAMDGSLSVLTVNTEPRPTRTMTEWLNGPVHVVELDGWDQTSGRYLVERRYVISPGTKPAARFYAPGSLAGISGAQANYVASPGLTEAAVANALSHAVKVSSFTAESEGLYARPATLHEKQILAPTTGTAGPLVPVQYSYDTVAGRAHVVTKKSQLATDASGAHVDLNYTSVPNGLFTVDRLKGVLVTATAPNQATVGSLSGEIGAQYTYDASGRWMTSIQARRDATSFYPWTQQEPTHDEMGRPLAQVDPNGISLGFSWDPLGRLTGITPSAPEVGKVITPDNSLRQVTVNRGAQQNIYFVNGFGELIAEQRFSDGGISHKLYGYDAGGRKMWESIWRAGLPSLAAWSSGLPSKGTQWTYDTRGRVTQETNPNGETIQTIYEVGGNPLVTQKVVAPGTVDQSTTTFENDVLGRLSKVTTSPDGAVSYLTTYFYDPTGRILQVQQKNPVSGSTQVRSWSYDGLGRLTTLVQPESGRTEYSAFTVSGLPTQTIYGAGINTPKIVTTFYDSLGRVKSVSSSDGSVDQSFLYDEAGRGASLGNLTTSRDGSVTIQHAYNGLNGRLSDFNTLTDSRTFLQSYAYNTYGIRTQAVMDGRRSVLAFNDSMGMATQLTYYGTGSTATGNSVLSKAINDPTMWIPTQFQFGNGASTTYQYRDDQIGLAGIAHYASGSSSPAEQWSYLYGFSGNLKTDGEDTYRYDLLNRLTRAVVKKLDGTIVTQKYSYDAFGNRLSSHATGSVPIDLVNLRFSSVTTELNQRNQIPAKTSAGVMTGATYDPQGNLARIWITPGSTTTQIGLVYDALGRVIQMSDARRPGFMEKYFYSPDGLRTRIEEYQGLVLTKTRYSIYNDQRQLVSKYRK